MNQEGVCECNSDEAVIGTGARFVPGVRLRFAEAVLAKELQDVLVGKTSMCLN